MKTRRALLGLALLGLTAILWQSRLEPGPLVPEVSVVPVDPLGPNDSWDSWDQGDQWKKSPTAVPSVEAGVPASLAGTVPDGALTVDAAGQFVASPEVRRFFDYFLAASGELPAAELRARIVGAIEARLHPDAAQAAIALLDRYLEFRRQARALAVRGVVPSDLQQRFAVLHKLRRDVLGPTAAEAFFGREEQQVAIDLRRREVLQAKGLTAEDRAARLWAIENERPAHENAARAAAERPLRLGDDEAALRAAGGSEDEIHSLRQQEVGAAAAERLAELDREQAEWQARLDAFDAARAAIEGNARLSDEARTQRLEALIDSQFDGPERLRVRARSGIP